MSDTIDRILYVVLLVTSFDDFRGLRSEVVKVHKLNNEVKVQVLS